MCRSASIIIFSWSSVFTLLESGKAFNEKISGQIFAKPSWEVHSAAALVLYCGDQSPKVVLIPHLGLVR